MITGETRLVGLIGNPVAASLSPRMQNAAFAARGLDWAYVPLRVEPGELEDALRGLVAFGFAGANVTAPYKLDVARLVGADESSVNTLVVREGRLQASSTDAAVLDGRRFDRPVVLGGGGAAAAFTAALPGASQFSRRGDWPPDVSEADLVVNATSERDEVWWSWDRGRRSLTFPIRETATARVAQGEVISGLEVLVAQGAASFELWTGLRAPVEVMRRALGLPA